MSDETGRGDAQVLYLEPDDEIPSVIRRLFEVHGTHTVVLVAPGRSKATSSAIGLRLIARRAAEAGLTVRLVADAGTRLVAGEAGLAAFATVAEAQSGDPTRVPEPPPRPRAAIHVVRGERVSLPSMATAPPLALAAAAAASPSPAVSRAEDTQAVPVVAPPPPPARTARGFRRPTGRRAWVWAIGALVVTVAVIAAVLPQATITLVPRSEPIGPLSYTVSLPSTLDQGQLTSTLSAPATGTHEDTTPATGEVTFRNYDGASHVVAKGTKVSAGDQVFTTDAGVSVPPGVLIPGGIAPGTASVAVTAVTGGPAANVAANAIDTVVTTEVADQLGGPFGYRRSLVRNAQPTSGGTSTTTPEITQADVDGLVSRIDADLATKLQGALSTGDRVYAAPSAAQDPSVQVPANLVGTTGQETFQLTGTLDYQRRWVAVADLRSAVLGQMHADTSSIPTGTILIDGSVSLSPTKVTVTGEQIQAVVTASGQVAPVPDESQLKARLSGKSREQVVANLADLGTATVDFWPGWVSSVPQLPFRITIHIETPSATPLPTASPTPAPTPAASGSGVTAPSPSPSP
jgi:hypothetical protein